MGLFRFPGQSSDKINMERLGLVFVFFLTGCAPAQFSAITTLVQASSSGGNTYQNKYWQSVRCEMDSWVALACDNYLNKTPLKKRREAALNNGAFCLIKFFGSLEAYEDDAPSKDDIIAYYQSVSVYNRHIDDLNFDQKLLDKFLDSVCHDPSAIAFFKFFGHDI